MASPIIDFHACTRLRSDPRVEGTGPGDDEIALMLRIATRVPDHGRLEPWRFILYRGKARSEIGEALAELVDTVEGPQSEGRTQKERERFSRAPLVIGVVSSPKTIQRYRNGRCSCRGPPPP